MSKYSKEFKEEALKLSDEIGIKKAALQLGLQYYTLHGSGNILVRRILDEIGVKNVFVVPEQELPDGNFPTVKGIVKLI